MAMTEPANWRDNQRVLLWLSIVTAAIFVPALVWGVVVLLRGEFLTAIVMWALGGAPILMMSSVCWVASSRGALRVSHDRLGTMLLPDRMFSAAVYGGLAAMVVGGTLYVILLMLGELALPMTRGWQLFSPVLVSSVVLVGILGLLSAWRRGGVGHVEVGPAGIDIANIVSTKSVKWDQVVDVRDSTEEKRTRKAIVLVLDDGTEEVIDGADFYVPQGAGLYWMVRHYWMNAEQRAELVDGRAAERLEAGRFDCQ
jgi:hypothetical protein